jgi:hypothetical protein
MISCLHDHFLDDQLLSTPHLYFLYFSSQAMIHLEERCSQRGRLLK